MGPQKDADINNTIRFVKAYECGILYDSFGWEGFPLINITSNPSILSKIIVQYGQEYISRIESESDEAIIKQINLDYFKNKDICPPAKLLVFHLLNKPYDQKLLDDSISYFNGCSSKEKKGAFSILYKLLNPFEVSNIRDD